VPKLSSGRVSSNEATKVLHLYEDLFKRFEIFTNLKWYRRVWWAWKKRL